MIRHSFESGLYLRSSKTARPRGTILYLHGLGESGLSLERLLADPRLGEWDHLAPDLPGYGKSPWPAAQLGLGEQADLLASWLHSHGVGPVIIFGHSMGGVVGLLICERHPQAIRAFINVEGNISPDDCTISKEIAALDLDELLAGALDELLDQFYRAGLEDRVLRDYFASARICDPRVYHLNSAELVELSGDGKLATRMAALEIPRIYLLGNPRGTGPRSRELLSRAGVDWRAVEAAGHWPFADQQEAFVDEILRFLESLPSG